LQAFDGVTTTLELELGAIPVSAAYAQGSVEGRPLNCGYSASPCVTVSWCSMLDPADPYDDPELVGDPASWRSPLAMANSMSTVVDSRDVIACGLRLEAKLAEPLQAQRDAGNLVLPVGPQRAHGLLDAGRRDRGLPEQGSEAIFRRDAEVGVARRREHHIVGRDAGPPNPQATDSVRDRRSICAVRGGGTRHRSTVAARAVSQVQTHPLERGICRSCGMADSGHDATAGPSNRKTTPSPSIRQTLASTAPGRRFGTRKYRRPFAPSLKAGSAAGRTGNFIQPSRYSSGKCMAVGYPSQEICHS